MVQLQMRQMLLSPGQKVLFKDISWDGFEQILDELGENRSSRVAYSQGILEIRMPLPEHEISKELISDMVKILLEELDIDCEPFGSTTFKRKDLGKGIEPDQCFYIKNQALMRGRDRIDLASDPPPDLAIEVDITSKTQLDIYRDLGVPEVWRFSNGQLKISVLRDGDYVESPDSPTFPNLPIVETFSEFASQSKRIGRSPTLKLFRQWARQQAQ